MDTGLPRFADHGLTGNHFGYVQTAAKPTHNCAKRHVSHASHGRENNGLINPNWADLDGGNALHNTA
jgi:hypothetical protein